jgi:hypothetical protein
VKAACSANPKAMSKEGHMFKMFLRAQTIQSLYVQDVFEGSDDTVTRWMSEQVTASCIEINGAESHLLDGMKQMIHPSLTACSQLGQKPLEPMKEADFALIYLNRDWYLMMLDYINARIENPAKHATLKEVHEMQRVWLLQCIFRETARNLFTDGPQWFAPVQHLCITYNRYAFLFKKLGADLPEISINVGYNDTKQDETAEHVWGSFNQHNEILGKMEAHVGTIGKNFLIETICDVTIDDDKLRHMSKTFSDHGLQRTGLRGSRCGPVMSGAGSVQSGLIFSIYFSRKGD